MSNFYQMFLAWGILLVVVLSFYLIDKVNTMYKFSVPAEIPKTYSDGLFGELVGKNLWDAMSGLPVQGIDPKLVENLKPHYEPVLRQHIEQTFMEGFRDGLAQKAGVPPNNRQIPTPRGSVESWLPLHHLATIYQAGSEFAIGNPEEHLRLQQNLDQVTAMLYARTNFELKDPYSETLLKLPIKEGLIPDPELVSQTVPEMLSLEGEKELSSEPLGENPNSEQSAKLQELSNSLSNFDALGEGEQVATAAHQPTPDESSVTTPQAAPLPPVEAQAVLEPGNLAVKEAQTV